MASGCRDKVDTRWQGYFEGEFVYVGSPLGGRLDELAVSRGERVDAGARLFTLERQAEVAASQEARQRLSQAEARLADLRKGQRPTEIAALEARLEQARTTSRQSALELERVTRLHDTQVVSDDDFDRARLTHERNAAQVQELEAQLATARLGARADAVAAAEADVAAARAAVERADWAVEQKVQVAPKSALVQDTLYRPGEFVAAGAPVVSLLPPENMRVRFFVPETIVGTLHAGDRVTVSYTGADTAIAATVSYISPKPEFTPPVLYNRENRSKLVFMIEAHVSPDIAAGLHPGQPVDVSR